MTAPVSEVKLQGTVHGGQQPVSGATVTLWKAGTSGYGAGATALYTTSTDGDGGFALSTGTTKDYSCSPTDLAYLTATGGNAGFSATNSAIAMMVALGPCGNLSTTQDILINEITTAASVYALAQFMSAPDGNLYSTQIGTSGSNLVGLQNAFNTVNNLVNTANGTSPGPTAPLGSIIPAATIYSLANSLASCINSTGSACTVTTPSPGLFPAVTPAAATAPVDTLQAALYIALNPANNVTAIYNLGTASAPFVGLPVAPNDWTAEISFNGSNASGGSFNIPFLLSLDSQGNVWVINNSFVPSSTTPGNTGGNFVAELSNNGALLSPTAGYAASSSTFSYPRGIAIDVHDNAWVSNDGTLTGSTAGGTVVGPANSNLLFSISASGAVSSFQTGAGTGTALEQPYGIAFDGSNNLYFPSQTLKQVGVVTGGISAPSLVTPASGANTTPATPYPPAVDSNGNVWVVGDSSSGGISYIPDALSGTATATSITASPFNAALYGVAIDGSNNAWVDTATKVYNVTSSGSVLQTCSSSGSLSTARFLAVDGGGNVWVTNLKNPGNVVEFSPTCAVLSGSTGYGAGTSSLMQNPRSIAIDSSGNVWVANNVTGASGSKTIVEIVGAGVPTVTPIAKALGLGKVGQKP